MWRFAWRGAIPVAAVLYLAAWPVPIEPLAWHPGPGPAREGPWAPNEALARVQRFSTGGWHGPEDVAVDDEGRIYGGVHEGPILRWDASGKGPEVFAETGGRPLGLHFAPDGRLLVADALRGLLVVDESGTVDTLLTEVDGAPLVFADDLDVGPDGVVYLSDASDRFPQPEWKLDLLETRPRGRLVSYDLATGEARTLLAGLWFANGVAVAEDGAFVLVNETSRYRVRRLWLRGPRAGEDEVFVDDLPGFPDGVSRGEDGVFWIALASPRKPSLDALGPYPGLRKVVARLPGFLQPAPVRHPAIVAVDTDGRVVEQRQDPHGRRYGVTTSVQQHGDWLYLGSLTEPAVARLRR